VAYKKGGASEGRHSKALAMGQPTNITVLSELAFEQKFKAKYNKKKSPKTTK